MPFPGSRRRVSPREPHKQLAEIATAGIGRHSTALHKLPVLLASEALSRSQYGTVGAAAAAPWTARSHYLVLDLTVAMPYHRGMITAAGIDSAFQALADPTRRRVVERLSRGPASVSELAAPFDMALPSFMQHLGVLERSGLVRSAKVGRVRTYEISAARLRHVENWMRTQRSMWEDRLNQLDSYVTRLHKERS